MNTLAEGRTAGPGRRARPTSRSAWALLGIAAVVGLGLGLFLVVPRWLPPAVPFDWPYGPGSLATHGLAGLLLGAAATTTAWTTPVSRGTAPRPGRRLPPALAVLALAWAALAPAVWSDRALLQGVALVATCLVPAGLLHATVALGPGGGPDRGWGVVVLTTYLVTGGLAVVRALSRDPFLDPGCVVACRSREPVLPWPDVAAATGLGLRVAGILVASAAVVLAANALVRVGTVPSRTTVALALVCAVVEASWLLLPEARAGLGPRPADLPQALVLRSVAWGLLAASVLTEAVVRVRRRAALRQMAHEIVDVTPPRSIRDVVAERLGEPNASLAFHVADTGWVDERGRPARATGGRAQTLTVRRAGRTVARISSTRAYATARDLEEVLGPATLLALEAARTRAEVLLRLRLLQDERRREVAARDDARRRAERDLHDGAQHLLLAATFALQEGMQHARDSGDHRLEQVLEAACAQVSDAARELRAVAHGLYPVLLNDAGLVPALEGLALEGTAVTTLDATRVGRTDPSTELTAYRAAALVVRAAQGGEVRLALARRGDRLVLTAHGAAPDPHETESLTDRATALGGTMETVDGTLRLELPCA